MQSKKNICINIIGTLLCINLNASFDRNLPIINNPNQYHPNYQHFYYAKEYNNTHNEYDNNIHEIRHQIAVLKHDLSQKSLKIEDNRKLTHFFITHHNELITELKETTERQGEVIAYQGKLITSLQEKIDRIVEYLNQLYQANQIYQSETNENNYNIHNAQN